VFIRVEDLQESKGKQAAPIEVEAQKDGYFVVQGLQPGRHYKLTARAKDGDKVLSGMTLAMPPNPRLSIYLSEEFTTPDTPAVPHGSSVPGQSPSGRNSDSGASLEAPVRPRPDEVPKETPPAAVPATAIPANPAQIASPGIRDGFQKKDPYVNIQGGPAPAQPPYNLPPGPAPAVPAPAVPRDDSPLSAPAEPAPAGGAAIRLPSVQVPVPSCVVAGGRVENFALYDLNGQAWEFRKHRIGKVVLLDFWSSTCPACLQSMSHVVDLQRRYSQYGLEVVAIADERGMPQDQALKARRVRGRYGITYTTLLSGGPHCPVRTQLRVEVLPTLVLLDDHGQILWHSKQNGLDEDNLRDLETEIRRRLDVR
jgi:thiol-disulfide isomerase/thioredoxin